MGKSQSIVKWFRGLAAIKAIRRTSESTPAVAEMLERRLLMTFTASMSALTVRRTKSTVHRCT